MTYLRSTGVSATASNTRFNLLGKVPAGAAALMLGVSGLAMMSGSAQAACTPATAGDDVIFCGVVVPETGIDALAGNDDIIILDPLVAGAHTGTYTGNTGNDTITLTGTGINPLIVNGTLDGGADNDTINLNNTGGLGTSVTTVLGGTGDDTITLDGAAATDILGGDGNDIIDLNSGTVSNDAYGGLGDDTITLNGATVFDLHGDEVSGGGNDTINVLSGNVTFHIDGDGGNDTITINGGNIAAVAGGSGEDFIDLNGGAITGSIDGEGDNDTIFLDGGSVGGSVFGGSGDDFIDLDLFSVGVVVTGDIDGGSGNDEIHVHGTSSVTNVLGGSGNDTILVDGGAVTGDVLSGIGDDTVTLTGGSVGASVATNTGDDIVTLNGGAIGTFIQTSSGNDTVNLLAGSVGTSVFTDTGEDTVTLAGATVTGNIETGQDADTINITGGMVANVLAGSESDMITMNGGTVTGDINANSQDDTILLNGGTVGGDVNGEAGEDVITLNGATVGTILGGGSNDTINLLSGTATGVFTGVNGGDGEDLITLDGATIVWDILGGADNDTINLLSGTAAFVEGQDGEDTITLDGADVGSIFGGADNDTINLDSGSAGSANGEAGEDLITLAGAAIAGSIDGGADNDTINVNSGSVGVSVLGGAGADMIALNGGSVGNDVDGGADNDVIALNGGTVGDSVFGSGGDDTITLNGSLVTNDLSSGSGDDVITLMTGSFGRDLLGGLGSDTATIESTYSLASIVGLLDGGDDVSAADGFIDTLVIQASGSLTGDNIVNWEEIDVNAGNTLVLGGAGLTTGADGGGGLGMTVSGFSTVDFDDGFALVGDLSVFGGSTLIADDGAGVYSISGYFIMDGVLDMSDGLGPNDVLTVGGTYDTFGADFLMDVALNSSEAGDLVVLNGNIIPFGQTEITFTDTDPLGAPSFTGTGPGNGIPIVDNSAFGAISDGDFIFDPVAHPTNEILKVPFVYTLNLESDDILYLQSDVLAQIYGYAILAELMREDFPILRERLGDKRYNGFSGDGTDNSGAAGGGVGWDNGGIWARLEGTKRTNEHRGDYTTGEWEASRIEAEVGIDIPMNVGGGQGLFGISTHFIQGFADANSGLTPDPDVAEVDTTGFGAGLSFVYFPGGGFYADVQGRFTAWDADVEVDNRSIDQDINALGWGTSLEVGNRMAFGNTAVTPRGRAVYSDVSFESFTDDDGVKVKQEDSASVVVEGGVTVEQMFPDNGVTIFADASVSHDVLRDSAIDASGFTFDSGLEDTWGTVAIGGSMETGQGTSAFIAAEVSSPFGTSFGNSVGYGLRAGVRVDF